eukprot:5920598-Amphidinium_carterae.1
MGTQGRLSFEKCRVGDISGKSVIWEWGISDNLVGGDTNKSPKNHRKITDSSPNHRFFTESPPIYHRFVTDCPTKSRVGERGWKSAPFCPSIKDCCQVLLSRGVSTGSRLLMFYNFLKLALVFGRLRSFGPALSARDSYALAVCDKDCPSQCPPSAVLISESREHVDLGEVGASFFGCGIWALHTTPTYN